MSVCPCSLAPSILAITTIPTVKLHLAWLPAILSACLWSCQPAIAAAGTTEATENTLVTDTLAADYEAALGALERGDDRVAAAHLWRLLEANPAHAGAWLDLGILYCENGMASSARQIFSLIEKRFEPSPAIRELIKHYRDSNCLPSNLTGRSQWTLGVSFGHDSNANLGVDQRSVTLFFGGIPTILDLTPSSRPRSDLGLSLHLGWQMAVKDDWLISASLSQRQYVNEHDYDQLRMRGEISRHRADTNSFDTFGFSYLRLDGRDYMRSLNARTRRPLTPESPWFLDASLSLQQYPAQRNYDSALSEARLGYRWRFLQGVFLQATAGAMFDLARHDRPGGNRRGPVAQLDFRALPASGWRIDGGLRWQQLDESKVYSPLFGAVKRRQRMDYAWLELNRRMAPQLRCSLSGQLLHSRNRLKLFDFSQRQLWLGCERSF